MITETPLDPAFTGVQAVPPPAAAGTAPKRRRRTGLLVAAALAALLIAALAGAAVVANSSLTNTYSPRAAVAAYFTAQQRHDVNAMLANAEVVRGDGSFSAYFDKPALSAMMQLPANSDVKNVRILSVRQVSSSDAAVKVALTWNGTPRTLTYDVRRDASQAHFGLYHSWKLQVPFGTLQVALPRQAGAIDIDGIALPPGGSTDKVLLIQGVHRVTMEPTNLLEAATQDVEVFDTQTVSLTGALSSTARAKAAGAVKAYFANCDAGKYDDCFDHTYNAPNDKYIWVMTLPGYGDVRYKNYKFTMTNDPTADMKLTIENETGKLTVSGVCTSTMTIDGKNSYNFKGDFGGALTWSGGGFNADLGYDCWSARA